MKTSPTSNSDRPMSSQNETCDSSKEGNVKISTKICGDTNHVVPQVQVTSSTLEIQIAQAHEIEQRWSCIPSITNSATQLMPMKLAAGTASFISIYEENDQGSDHSHQQEQFKSTSDHSVQTSKDNCRSGAAKYVGKNTDHALEECVFYRKLRSHVLQLCDLHHLNLNQHSRSNIMKDSYKDSSSTSATNLIRSSPKTQYHEQANLNGDSVKNLKTSTLLQNVNPHKQLRFIDEFFCACPGEITVSNDGVTRSDQDNISPSIKLKYKKTQAQESDQQKKDSMVTDVSGSSDSPAQTDWVSAASLNNNSIDVTVSQQKQIINNSKNPSHPLTIGNFLVLRNFHHGFCQMRFADLKIGRATAVAGWMGKSTFRAWRNNQIDRFTNSVSEGFRVEGMELPPAILNDYTSAKSTMLASLVLGSQKVGRMTIQRLSAIEFWSVFLEMTRVGIQIRQSNQGSPGGLGNNDNNFVQDSDSTKTTEYTRSSAPHNQQQEDSQQFKKLNKNDIVNERSSQANINQFQCSNNAYLRQEYYCRYILLRILAKLTKLLNHLCRFRYPQMWVGSSIGIGFELEEWLEMQSVPESTTQLNQTNNNGNSNITNHKRNSIRDPVVKLFDWGRSELNDESIHPFLSTEEKKQRVEKWREYIQSLSRFIYQSARVYLHRYGCPCWKTIVIELLEFHVMHPNIVKACVKIPLFRSQFESGHESGDSNNSNDNSIMNQKLNTMSSNSTTADVTANSQGILISQTESGTKMPQHNKNSKQRNTKSKSKSTQKLKQNDRNHQQYVLNDEFSNIVFGMEYLIPLVGKKGGHCEWYPNNQSQKSEQQQNSQPKIIQSQTTTVAENINGTAINNSSPNKDRNGITNFTQKEQDETLPQKPDLSESPDKLVDKESFTRDYNGTGDGTSYNLPEKQQMSSPMANKLKDQVDKTLPNLISEPESEAREWVGSVDQQNESDHHPKVATQQADICSSTVPRNNIRFKIRDKMNFKILQRNETTNSSISDSQCQLYESKNSSQPAPIGWLKIVFHQIQQKRISIEVRQYCSNTSECSSVNHVVAITAFERQQDADNYVIKNGFTIDQQDQDSTLKNSTQWYQHSKSCRPLLEAEKKLSNSVKKINQNENIENRSKKLTCSPVTGTQTENSINYDTDSNTTNSKDNSKFSGKILIQKSQVLVPCEARTSDVIVDQESSHVANTRDQLNSNSSDGHNDVDTKDQPGLTSSCQTNSSVIYQHDVKENVEHIFNDRNILNQEVQTSKHSKSSHSESESESKDNLARDMCNINPIYTSNQVSETHEISESQKIAQKATTSQDRTISMSTSLTNDLSDLNSKQQCQRPHSARRSSMLSRTKSRGSQTVPASPINFADSENVGQNHALEGSSVTESDHVVYPSSSSSHSPLESEQCNRISRCDFRTSCSNSISTTDTTIGSNSSTILTITDTPTTSQVNLQGKLSSSSPNQDHDYNSRSETRIIREGDHVSGAIADSRVTDSNSQTNYTDASQETDLVISPKLNENVTQISSPKVIFQQVSDKINNTETVTETQNNNDQIQNFNLFQMKNESQAKIQAVNLEVNDHPQENQAQSKPLVNKIQTQNLLNLPYNYSLGPVSNDNNAEGPRFEFVGLEGAEAQLLTALNLSHEESKDLIQNVENLKIKGGNNYTSSIYDGAANIKNNDNDQKFDSNNKRTTGSSYGKVNKKSSNSHSYQTKKSISNAKGIKLKSTSSSNNNANIMVNLATVFPSVVSNERQGSTAETDEHIKRIAEVFGDRMTKRYFDKDFLYYGKNPPKGWLDNE